MTGGSTPQSLSSMLAPPQIGQDPARHTEKPRQGIIRDVFESTPAHEESLRDGFFRLGHGGSPAVGIGEHPI